MRAARAPQSGIAAARRSGTHRAPQLRFAEARAAACTRKQARVSTRWHHALGATLTHRSCERRRHVSFRRKRTRREPQRTHSVISPGATPPPSRPSSSAQKVMMWRRRCSACSKSSAEVGAAEQVCKVLASGHAGIASAEACARVRRFTTCAWRAAASRRDCAALARAAGVAGRATGRAPGNAAACATSRLPHSRSTLSASSCVSSASATWRSAAASPRQRPWHARQGCQCRSRARARASRKVDGPDVLQVPASAKASSLELLRRAAIGRREGTQRVSACAALCDEARAHRAHARRHRQRADGDAEAARRGARHRRPNARATQRVLSRHARKDGAAQAPRRVCVAAAQQQAWERGTMVSKSRTKSVVPWTRRDGRTHAERKPALLARRRCWARAHAALQPATERTFAAPPWARRSTDGAFAAADCLGPRGACRRGARVLRHTRARCTGAGYEPPVDG